MLKSHLKQVETDPFQCTCGPCKTFWKRTFQGPGELLHKSALARAADTSVILEATLKREDHPAVLRLGDRVVVKGVHKGTVRFVGVLTENKIAPDTYVGVQLDDNIGSDHNGVYKGKRYFYCPRGHGVMVKYSDVIRCNPPEKRPPTRGNYMFPSFNEIRSRRKSHAESSPERTNLPGLVTPTDNGGQDKRVYKRESRKYVFDKQDIAVKDALRREHLERTRLQRARAQQQRQEEATMQSNMQQWKERFGNNDQAERMANALKKLHAGYAKGRALKRRQDLGILTDSDGDEDDLSESEMDSKK